MCHSCGERRPRKPYAKFCAECITTQDEAALARKRARERMRHGKPCRGCGRPKGHGRRRVYCDPCQRARASRVRQCERCPNPTRSATAKLCTDCKIAAREDAKAYKREWARRNAPDGGSGTRTDTIVMRQRLNAERAGRALEPAAPIRVDSGAFPELPSWPLVLFIEREIKRQETRAQRMAMFSMPSGESLGVQARVCEDMGTSYDYLKRWRAAGEGGFVKFDTADKVIAAAGVNWWDVYSAGDVAKNGRSVEWVFETTELVAS